MGPQPIRPEKKIDPWALAVNRRNADVARAAVLIALMRRFGKAIGLGR